jgi:hypothetical protein
MWSPMTKTSAAHHQAQQIRRLRHPSPRPLVAFSGHPFSPAPTLTTSIEYSRSTAAPSPRRASAWSHRHRLEGQVSQWLTGLTYAVVDVKVTVTAARPGKAGRRTVDVPPGRGASITPTLRLGSRTVSACSDRDTPLRDTRCNPWKWTLTTCEVRRSTSRY